MAGISSSSVNAAPLSALPEPLAAEGHGGGADKDNDNNTFSPLLDLVERFPDLFAQKVLAHVDPIDRTFLAQAGSACRVAVAASDLPRAGARLVGRVVRGKSEWVVTHRLVAFCTSVERLAWAKSNGCPWVKRTCATAAWVGRLEVLQWARAHGCLWGALTCACAARGGHLEMLKWVREHGCPWNSRTCCSAADGGHLEVLRWARAHDCPCRRVTV